MRGRSGRAGWFGSDSGSIRRRCGLALGPSSARAGPRTAPEAVSVFIRLTLFSVLASLQVAVVRQEIRSKLGHGAVSSLLGMVCDAAVDVDETLKLKHHEESATWREYQRILLVLALVLGLVLTHTDRQQYTYFALAGAASHTHAARLQDLPASGSRLAHAHLPSA